MTLERAIEVKTYMYLWIIGFVKAFDCVKHNEIRKLKEHLNIDKKDLKIMRDTHCIKQRP